MKRLHFQAYVYSKEDVCLGHIKQNIKRKYLTFTMLQNITWLKRTLDQFHKKTRNATILPKIGTEASNNWYFWYYFRFILHLIGLTYTKVD